MIKTIKPELIFFFIIALFLQNIYAIPSKVSDINQKLTCKDCCYPVDNSFCKLFYLSCNTNSFKNNIFLQANKKLAIEQIYNSKNIKNTALIIPDGSLYLIRKYFKNLQIELKRNIKKLDDIGTYQKQLYSIKYNSIYSKVYLAKLNTTDFINLLKNYKSLVETNNFPKEINFPNKDNIRNCSIDRSSIISTVSYKPMSISDFSSSYYLHTTNYIPILATSIQPSSGFASSSVASSSEEYPRLTITIPNANLTTSIQPSSSFASSSVASSSEEYIQSTTTMPNANLTTSIQPSSGFASSSVISSSEEYIQSTTTMPSANLTTSIQPSSGFASSSVASSSEEYIQSTTTMPSANLTTSIQPSSGFASSSVISSSEEYIQSTTTMPSANLTTSIQPSSGFASSSVASSSEEYIQSTTTMPSANLTTSIQPSSGFASSSVASSSEEYIQSTTTMPNANLTTSIQPSSGFASSSVASSSEEYIQSTTTMPNANLTTSIQPSSSFASSSVASSSEEYIQSTTTMPSANLTTSIQPSSGFASSSVASSSKEYPSPITTIISSVISTYPSRIISFSVVKNKKTSPTTVNKLPTIATEQKIMSYHISSYKTNLKSLPTTTLAGINNSIMKATNKTNNYIIYIVSSVAGFVIITAIVIIIYKYHSKQKQKERQKKLQLQRQKNTLKLKGIYEMDSDNSNEYLDDLDDLNEPYQLKSFQPQV